MRIHTLTGPVIGRGLGYHICANKNTMQCLTEDFVTNHISISGEDHPITLFVGGKVVLFYQSIVNAIQHLTLTEAVKIKVSVFLLQRECFAFWFQKQPPCFIGLVHRCQQTGLVLFVEGVYVAEIEQIVIVVLGLRHTADTTDGLNLKLLAHTLTKLHEDFGPWAIPAGTDGLFHKQKNGLCIVFGEIFRQIAFVLAHLDTDHTIVIGIAHFLQLLFAARADG